MSTSVSAVTPSLQVEPKAPTGIDTPEACSQPRSFVPWGPSSRGYGIAAVAACRVEPAAPARVLLQERRTQPPEVRSVTNIMGVDVVHDQPSYWQGRFITPNEGGNYGVAPYLPSGGTLISVGAMRGLQLAGAHDFESVVQFDFDLGITAFNTLVIEILKVADNRHEFLNLLIAGTKDAVSPEVAARLSLPEHLEHLKTRAKGSHARLRESGVLIPTLSSEYQAFIQRREDDPPEKKAPKDVLELVERANYGKAIGELMFEPASGVNGNITSYVKEGDPNKHFLGNDEHFAKVKRLAMAGRIFPVTADLTKDGALVAAAKALAAAGQNTSAIDVSNVPQWIFDNGAYALPGAQKNLKALPYAAHGRVIYTTGAMIDEKNKVCESAGWCYHVIAPSSLDSRFRNEFSSNMDGNANTAGSVVAHEVEPFRSLPAEVVVAPQKQLNRSWRPGTSPGAKNPRS